MIWRFPDRSEYAWAQQACAGLLCLMVLAGGLCPALYADQIPHEHLFVGGVPPANWEQHEHPDPLFTFFGAPRGSSQPTNLGTSASGRVISVYDGLALVLSIMVVTVALPLLDSLPRPDPGREIIFPFSWPLQPLDRGPLTPPPRAA